MEDVSPVPLLLLFCLVQRNASLTPPFPRSFNQAYTDAELKHTPPTLDELKEERIKRERRARKDLEGYRILRKGSGVAWDEALEGRFGVWKWDEGADSTAGGGAGGVGGSEFV